MQARQREFALGLPVAPIHSSASRFTAAKPCLSVTLLSDVINRPIAIDPQDAKFVSCNAQRAGNLDATRSGRKPDLRFRMGTGTDNRDP